MGDDGVGGADGVNEVVREMMEPLEWDRDNERDNRNNKGGILGGSKATG